MIKKTQKIWHILLSFQGEVFGYLKQALGDGEIAKDLFQEVYLRALQHLDELDEQRSLKAWLMTVSRHLVVNYYRDSRRRTFVRLDEQTGGSTSARWVTGDEAVEQALKTLPERQRQVLLRRELDGVSYEALAREFNLSLSALTSLLKRARENLKRHYQLFFLPEWVRKGVRDLPLDDLLRFVSEAPLSSDVMHQVQEESQRFFSRIRHRWDTLRNRFFPQERLEGIFAALEIPGDSVVLDAGSGTGMVAVKAALRARKVIALELNRQMVRQLRQLRKQLGLFNLSIVRADMRRLCLTSESVDFVFATLVLHHLPRPQHWLKETARVLKPGGRFVVVDFDRHGNKQLADTMHDLWLGFPPHVLRRWAEEAGLHEVAGESWQSDEGLPVYYRIFEKQKGAGERVEWLNR